MYIYIYIYAYFVKQYRHPFSTCLCICPFELALRFYGIWWELVNEFPRLPSDYGIFINYFSADIIKSMWHHEKTYTKICKEY